MHKDKYAVDLRIFSVQNFPGKYFPYVDGVPKTPYTYVILYIRGAPVATEIPPHAFQLFRVYRDSPVFQGLSWVVCGMSQGSRLPLLFNCICVLGMCIQLKTIASAPCPAFTLDVYKRSRDASDADSMMVSLHHAACAEQQPEEPAVLPGNGGR